MTPELQKILDTIDKLDRETEAKIEKQGQRIDRQGDRLDGLHDEIDKLDDRLDELANKFQGLSDHQKASQTVLNLAYSLIASATLVTIVSNVFPR